jgi:hypothetical protein
MNYRQEGWHQPIRISEFQRIPPRRKNICRKTKILLACNLQHVLHISTFDENLLKHISHELADDAGPESLRGTS